jgi:hypothetical protein
MTQDEIIEMAKQAGFDPHDMSSDFTCNLKDINAFAKLVAEHEREACAKVCDDINAVYNRPEDSAERVASQWCAERIRVRGLA